MGETSMPHRIGWALIIGNLSIHITSIFLAKATGTIFNDVCTTFNEVHMIEDSIYDLNHN